MGDDKFMFGELTGNLINISRRIFSELNYGHPEKVYQKAMEVELSSQGIPYKRECYSKVLYNGSTV